jgi:septum formation protein
MAAASIPASSQPFKLILGSSSVARKHILAEMGLEFEVMTADIDEKSIRRENPDELVTILAEAKVRPFLSFSPHFFGSFYSFSIGVPFPSLQ